MRIPPLFCFRFTDICEQMQTHMLRSTIPGDSAGAAGGSGCQGLSAESGSMECTGQGPGMFPKGAEDATSGGKCCSLMFQRDGKEARERQRPTGCRLLSDEVIVTNVITQKRSFLSKMKMMHRHGKSRVNIFPSRSLSSDLFMYHVTSAVPVPQVTC